MMFIDQTDEKLAQFVQDHSQDFGEEFDPTTAQKITEAILADGAFIEKRPHGFAILRPPRDSNKSDHIILWYFYISEECREKGNGESFVQDLIAKHAIGKSMVLRCDGTKRRKFFERCGFAKLHVECSNDGHSMRYTPS
ncbi:GNAT family N-acetyltransferase [Glaciimonas sp. GNP009]